MASRKSRVYDGWLNTLKGLGVTAASALSTVYSPSQPLVGDSQYEHLFENDWLARRIVQIFPDEAMKRVPAIDGVSGSALEALWEEYDRLNGNALYPHGILAQGLYQGRALGGSAIVLGFKGGPALTKPAPEPGPQATLAWLDVVPWEYLTVVAREQDPRLPNFGQPTVYRITGEHERRNLELHVSRLIPCEGLPRIKPRRSDLTPWLSVLQPVYDVLKDYGLSWNAAGTLLQEASIGVLKLSGLIDLISSQNDDAVKARMNLMATGRSAAKTVFLDADMNEEFSRTEVSFTGVPQILEQLERRLCGAAKVPATKLFGRSPGGMQSTGDAELRMFYDDVSVYRELSVYPKQARLMSLIAGKPLTLTYPPLWEPTAKESAEIRKANAEADRMWYDLQVLEPDEIRKARAADGSLGVDVDPGRVVWSREQEEAEEQAKLEAMAAIDPQQPQQSGQPDQEDED